MATYKLNWDLAKYFYKSLDDPKLQIDIDKVDKQVDKFIKKYKGKIKNIDAKRFLNYYDDMDKLDKFLEKPSFYISFLNSLDTQNNDVIKKLGELQNMFIEIDNKMLFISQEFKQLGYEKLMILSKKTILSKHKNSICKKAIGIKYLLNKSQEYVLNVKSKTTDTIGNLHNELTNSFMFPITINGKKKEVTEEEIRSMRSDPSEAVRKKAQESLRSVYNQKQMQITLGNIYSGIVKDRTTDIELRGYKYVMEPRNMSEQMDKEVIDMLMKHVQKSYPLYQRYIKAKQRLLKKKKFFIWDAMAPITKIEKKFTFTKAVDLYMDTIKNFDKEFFDYSKDMLTKGRVDVMPKKGKRGGAFACYDKGVESFVLLNFTGKIRDVATIAHELGHAIHGHLSQKQPNSVFSSPLSLAETASIFNEMLLSDNLKSLLTKKETTEFLNKQLEDVFATIFRQIQYVTFEKEVHQQIFDGKELIYHDFNNIWRKTQIQMTGKSVTYDVPTKEESTWSMIPHIFNSPFYCYSYSFGNILVFALFNKYKKEGKKFIPTYKAILSAGGSLPPKELLKKYGIDITKDAFYKAGIEEIEKMVIEFEKLSLAK